MFYGSSYKLVAEATGLKINCFLGGSQEHRGTDLFVSKVGGRFPERLLRLCDVHNIPFATNIATAEALIRGVERGDFEWREIVNPKYNH